MRIVSLLFVLFVASPLFADEPRIHLDLPYADPKNERQTLDVYAPTKGQGRPVVVWIHGGGWRVGDKAGVQHKPQAFVDKGYVFVSTNYRFVPQVTVKEMAGDIAKAIRWVHDHAQEYGGDPNSLFVMGHSAGAHLAALVCTDERYLKGEGLSLSIIKGCVPVDTAVYDVRKQVASVAPARAGVYDGVFGNGAASQQESSPITYVTKGKSIPPFLILHVADRPDSKAQSHLFADKLKEAGVPVQVMAAEGTTHGTINSNLGKMDDKPTQQIWDFMRASLASAQSASAEQIDKLKQLGARLTLDDQHGIIGVNLGERKVSNGDLVLLRGLPHLQELDLTRTRITGAGLAAIQNLPSLKKLYLTDTQVDDSGIAHLKGMKTLELVGLSGTKISDAALDHFQELTELKQVFCLGTNVTEAGAEKLRRALPGCRVTN